MLWAIEVTTRSSTNSHLFSGGEDGLSELITFLQDLHRGRRLNDQLGMLAFKPPILVSIREAE